MTIKYENFRTRHIIARSLKNYLLKKIRGNSFEKFEDEKHDNKKRIVARAKCESGEIKNLGNIILDESDSHYEKTKNLNCSEEEKVYIYLERPIFNEKEMTAKVHFMIITEDEWEMVEFPSENSIMMADNDKSSDTDANEKEQMLSVYYTPNKTNSLWNSICNSCLCKFCKNIFDF